MATYTSGPWHVEKDEDGSHFVIDDMREMDPIYIDQSPPTNSAANARLISAAPEMLSALQFCLTNGSLPHATEMQVRAAIAKATQ